MTTIDLADDERLVVREALTHLALQYEYFLGQLDEGVPRAGPYYRRATATARTARRLLRESFGPQTGQSQQSGF